MDLPFQALMAGKAAPATGAPVQGADSFNIMPFEMVVNRRAQGLWGFSLTGYTAMVNKKDK
jgi:hypothetical protein